MVSSLYPVFIDQGIFINGSHPLLGLSFVLCAIASQLHILLSDNKKQAIVWSMLSCILFLACLFSSPITQIVSLGGIILVIYPMCRSVIVVKRIAIVSASVVPIVLKGLYLWLNAANYNHYLNMKGWTDFSLKNMISQFVFSAKMTFSTLGWKTICFFVFVVAGAIFVRLIFKVKNKSTNKKEGRLILSVLFFLISALFFAPVSILTQVYTRYLVAPLFFLNLAIGMALHFIVRKHSYARYFSIAGLSIMGLIMIGVSKDLSEKTFSSLLDCQKKIQSFVRDESSGWKPDSQIIFVLNKMPVGFTNGYNHWSTWYLRYISKRMDIIGLIGSKNWLNEDQIILEYSDYSSKDFFSVVEAQGKKKLQRKRMIGIEIGKPTYIYIEQVDGKYLKYDQILKFEDKEYKIYSANEKGINLLSSGQFEFTKLCSALDGNADTTLVFGKPHIESYKISDELAESNIYYSGKTFDTITIPEGKHVNLELVISSEKIGAENISFSARTDIYPPMPFYWGKLWLYQISHNAYRIGNSNIFEKDNEASMCIEVINNCGYMINPSVGDPTIGLGEYYSNAPLILGRGYKNRYWKGTIKKLKIEVENHLQNTIVITKEDF
jgi:hypothetical protein